MLIRGEKSLHGEASLEDAVLDPPPGDCIGEITPPAQSSVGIISESPVAEDDLTMALFCFAPPEEDPGEADFVETGEEVMTNGLGVTGSTEPRPDMGRLRGPLLVSFIMVGIGEFIPEEGDNKPDLWPSSMEMENLGRAALAAD